MAKIMIIETPKMKTGGWISDVKKSIKRRGTEGVCTGSKFGGPSCRPGTRRYALAKTFRKMAKARKKEDGGELDMYEDGGEMDAYQLMGIPTPPMYGMGGYAPIGMYSHVMSRKNVPNMGMAYGGMVPAYKKGGFANTMEDVGKLALNTLAAPVEQVTGNNFVNWNYNNDWAADTAAVSEGVIGGATDVAGSVFLGPAYGMGKGQLQQFTKGMGTSQEKQRGAADWANKTGQIASSAGDLTAGIMSGNPQQIVGGAGKFLSTTGSELGSKELGTLGNFASMGSSFINPGTNTPQFGYPNYYGNYGSFPMMAAMGGQVNYPEGLQMGDGSYVPMMNRPTTDRLLSNRSANRIPTFAMGGSTGNTIDINVEKGELLIDPKTGKILTEYRGGGMVPHPPVSAENPQGMDERGTVSAPEGKFIIPKKYAKRYEEADKLGRQSIEQRTIVEKAKKEAKEKQVAMAEEQKAAKAMNRMVAKYGGAIQRMYANGGNVMKYALGDYVDGGPDSLGNFPPAIANVLSGVQPNPFLLRLNNTTQTVATPVNQVQQSQMGTGLTVPGYGLPEVTIQGQAPQGVIMSPGLYQNIQQSNQAVTQPATRQPWSLERTMQGIQPNPFLQRVMQGVPPSRTFQNIVNPSGSVVTPPNTSSTPRPATPSVNRPAYVAPGTTRTTPTTRRVATPSTPTPSVSSFLSGYTPYYAPDSNELPPNTNPFPWGYGQNTFDPTEQDIPRLEAIEGGYPIQNVDKNGVPVYDLADLTEPQAARTLGAPSYGTPSYSASPAMQGTEGFKSPSASGTGSTGYTPSPSAIQGNANAGGGAGMGTSQMDKYLMAAQFLPAAYNIGRGLFEKAWQPGTYETPADLKWEDMTGEAGRRNMLRAYNLAKYNARQIGGSGALAALQAGSTGYQQNLADYEEALENRNKLGRAEVNRLNKAIQQANMQMRMQRDYLAQQAREQKAAMVGAGIEGLGQGAGQLWQNKQMMDALRIAYPQNTYTPGTTPSTTPGSSITPSMPFTGGERIMFDTSRPSVRQIRSWNSYKG